MPPAAHRLPGARLSYLSHPAPRPPRESAKILALPARNASLIPFPVSVARFRIV